MLSAAPDPVIPLLPGPGGASLTLLTCEMGVATDLPLWCGCDVFALAVAGTPLSTLRSLFVLRPAGIQGRRLLE